MTTPLPTYLASSDQHSGMPISLQSGGSKCKLCRNAEVLCSQAHTYTSKWCSIPRMETGPVMRGAVHSWIMHMQTHYTLTQHTCQNAKQLYWRAFKTVFDVEYWFELMRTVKNACISFYLHACISLYPKALVKSFFASIRCWRPISSQEQPPNSTHYALARHLRVRPQWWYWASVRLPSSQYDVSVTKAQCIALDQARELQS